MFRNVSTLGGAGIPGVISSAPAEITLSAVRLRRRRRRKRLQEKFLDLILSSLLIAHQLSVKSPYVVDIIDLKVIECKEINPTQILNHFKFHLVTFVSPLFSAVAIVVNFLNFQ